MNSREGIKRKGGKKIGIINNARFRLGNEMKERKS
jgi:hypothetical protein